MTKKKMMCVVGVRPEFIRMAPIIEAVRRNKDLELLILHTGQHYSYKMNEVFFDELGIPKPTVNLEVGSGSHGWQTAQVMMRTEKALEDLRPDLVAVFGDTNSSAGVALAAVKMQIPLAHIEAGCRSYDLRMPEEINRRLIDHCANFLFPVSEHCREILEQEKVPGKIFQCGDPLYDMFLKNREMAAGKSKILEKLGLGSEPLAIVTLHRAENVDNPLILKTIIGALAKIKTFRVVFPIHPRTESRLKECGALKIIPPVGYWDFLVLLSQAGLVITDSGGVQKEAFFAQVPCVTLRKSTEWVETVESGANTLLDPESDRLSDLLIEAVDRRSGVKEKLEVLENPYGDGRAAGQIVNILSRMDL